MQWYYEGSDGQVGPVSDEEFQSLVKGGSVNYSTLVWNSTMTDWKEYGRLIAPSGKSGNANSAICAECGRSFSKNDMIRYGESWVCAQCKPVFVQKIKEGVTITQMDYAGFWIRFGAVIIDGIIMGAVNFAINIALTSLGMLSASSPEDMPGFFKYYIIAVSINMSINLAYEVFFIGKWGATIGKMACGLKVVTADGNSITYLRSFARYLSKYVSYLTIYIGFIIAAFDDEKRALHDRICSTRVIRK